MLIYDCRIFDLKRYFSIDIQLLQIILWLLIKYGTTVFKMPRYTFKVKESEAILNLNQHFSFVLNN